MTDEITEEFYEFLALYYRKSFKIRLENNIIKRGIFCLCRKRDFNFEMVCLKENLTGEESDVPEEDRLFTLVFPLPFSYDHDDNSILLDYRLANITKSRESEILKSLKELLTDSTKHHRFMDSIVEIEFL